MNLDFLIPKKENDSWAKNLISFVIDGIDNKHYVIYCKKENKLEEERYVAHSLEDITKFILDYMTEFYYEPKELKPKFADEENK